MVHMVTTNVLVQEFEHDMIGYYGPEGCKSISVVVKNGEVKYVVRCRFSTQKKYTVVCTTASPEVAVNAYNDIPF